MGKVRSRKIDKGSGHTPRLPPSTCRISLSAPVLGKPSSQGRGALLLSVTSLLGVLNPPCLVESSCCLVAWSECRRFLLTLQTLAIQEQVLTVVCCVLSLGAGSLLAVLQPHGPLPEPAAALSCIPTTVPDTTQQVGLKHPVQRPLCCLLRQVPFKKRMRAHSQYP